LYQGMTSVMPQKRQIMSGLVGVGFNPPIHPLRDVLPEGARGFNPRNSHQNQRGLQPRAVIVCLALTDGNTTDCIETNFRSNRSTVREFATQQALDLIRKRLM